MAKNSFLEVKYIRKSAGKSNGCCYGNIFKFPLKFKRIQANQLISTFREST